ncbi:MAG: 23S rRNA (uracil(1939)-C(5))-methyltransferase RlmD [Candidatus Dadabacteria bacterium]|nr:23S rRNA (uracil(1939)-C(5))-methyltransferase RlmD [Candidatus Dadabacteria bacterium]
MQIEIEKIAFGGAGIAKKDGKVFFVRGGLPKDVLEINIIKDKGNYAEAVIAEIIKPSPDRIEPDCPVFNLCGGCQLQNLNYPAQLREKEYILKETLGRLGGLYDVAIEPIVPSPKEFGFRNKVTLSTWFYKGKWHVGYNQKGSNRKVAIDSCPISTDIVDKTIKRISEVLASLGDPYYPLEKIHISSNGLKSQITLVPRHSRRGDLLKTLLKHLRRHQETENVSINGSGETGFEFSILGNKFLTTPSAFTQVNSEINELMIKTVLDWAELTQEQTVLDLYSGIGNFSIPLALGASEVLAVEISNNSVKLARKSAQANSVNNLVFQNAASEHAIEVLNKDEEKFDLIVLDPPREGAKEIIEGLVELSPTKVIYVSCDPATLSRDLKRFDELGYKVVKVRPFDMFPQTFHIESIALLCK